MADHNFYLTTTLPYVNAEPHIGFALEITEADVICRYRRLVGDQVIFNTGTDEHGQKIYQQAVAAGKDPQTYCDEYAAKFADLKALLNLSYDKFIRTTDQYHIQAAQEFWLRVNKNGFIYKKNYQTKYCVGCELEKTDSELVDGRCPLHPNKELEIRDEENYFFKFSSFQEKLLNFYTANPNFVKPAGKYKEIVSFVSQGLQDFSISRLKAKMPWGIPVPGDDEHVMYVWFDALINYISTLGWPEDEQTFQNFWPGRQVCGKDNLRQQAAMWQAMLMAADLPNSKQILINGFISVAGQKMSKSLGNVISPLEMTDKYGNEPARYLLISLGTFGGDMDATWERFNTIYTANLTNGLGNLCSRIAKMCEKNGADFSTVTKNNFNTAFNQEMEQFNLTAALNWIDAHVNLLDEFLNEHKPWQQTGDEQTESLTQAVNKILNISYHLQPFMPETAAKMLKHFSQPKISALLPLFPRLA
jgi:methionyl-tRNA synthetase